MLAGIFPAQLGNDFMSQLLGSSVDSLSTVMKSTMYASLASNVAFSSSLSFILGAINTLQLIAYIPLICDSLPGNAKFLFYIFQDISNFQLFSLEKVTNAVFSFSETSPFNQQFTEQGFATKNTIINLQNTFYLICLVLILMLIVTLTNKIAKKYYYT